MTNTLDASIFNFGSGYHEMHLKEAMTMLSTAYSNVIKSVTYGDDFNENKLRDDLVKNVSAKRAGTLMTFDTESRNLDRNNVRIDISIITLEVLSQLSDDFEKRLTIECKIIGVDQYVNRNGIISYVEGKYASQLGCAGMIGFITSGTPEEIKDKINGKLKSHSTIVTIKFLTSLGLTNGFLGAYESKHNRNLGLAPIDIYHLLFDYSAITTIKKAVENSDD